MKAIIHVIKQSLFVVYTNENVKIQRGVRFGHERCGVKYYFCTRKGVDKVTNNDHSKCKIIGIHRNPTVKEMDQTIKDYFKN